MTEENSHEFDFNWNSEPKAIGKNQIPYTEWKQMYSAVENVIDLRLYLFWMNIDI